MGVRRMHSFPAIGQILSCDFLNFKFPILAPKIHPYENRNSRYVKKGARPLFST